VDSFRKCDCCHYYFISDLCNKCKKIVHDLFV
jgi:rRNA maturation protein Nop10